MSPTDTTNPTVPAESESEAPPVEVIADGSTVTNEEKLAEIKAALTQTLRRGITGFRSMTTTLKSVAESRVNARRYIMRNGHPDWSGKSDAYRLLIESAESEVWNASNVTNDEKRRIDGSIRQHVSRTFLEIAIMQYVRETVNGLAEATESDEVFKSAVASEYRAADLKVPVKFGGESPGNGSGPGQGSQDNPAAALESTVKALDLGKVAPMDVLTAVYRLVSEESVILTADASAAIADRPNVLLTLERIAIVTNLTAKVLHGKASAEEIKTLGKALFDPSK